MDLFYLLDYFYTFLSYKGNNIQDVKILATPAENAGFNVSFLTI